jgi:hypothetical protein
LAEFSFHPLRFSFKAIDPFVFPAGKTANLLRGAFGATFRKLACAPHCRDARACPLGSSCAYARIFEPAAASSDSGPSGFANRPRPFVFRAWRLDGRSIAAGEAFHFDLNVFLLRDPALLYFAQVFAQIAEEGFGARRGRATLIGANEHGFELPVPVTLSLDPPAAEIRRIQVRFVTPMELKDHEQIAGRPEFSILFARVRDRIAALSAFYGAGPLSLDFRGLAERAATVRLTRCDLRHVDIQRRSSRTGQVHPIGGFTGEAEYEGPLSEFVPFLEAACYTGVGRQTVWGKGELAIDYSRA